MNKALDNNDDNFLISFSDLINVAKKNNRKIVFSSIIVALFAFFYGLTKPIEYQAEATFKEKGKNQSGLGKSLSGLFFIGDGLESDAMTIMKSRTLVEQLVQALGLQLSISKKGYSFPFLPIQTIKNNILVEYALFKNLSAPILDDPEVDLQAVNVFYSGESPLGLRLFVHSEDAFTLYDGKGEKLGEVFFGQSFSSDNFSITLIKGTSTSLKGSEYGLFLQPLGAVAKKILKQFTIEADRNDKSLLKISYKHPNRSQVAVHINGLMSAYEQYIQKEHHRISGLQVDYLVTRQTEMAKQLEDVMQEHARKLSADLSTTGFATSAKAMDFLASSQENFKQKLLTIDLEIQRLETLINSNSLDYERCTSSFHPEIINKMSTEIRSLRQQSDALTLAIREAPLNLESFQESFSNQWKGLDEIKECAKEAKLMLASLEKDEIPYPFERLMNNPKAIVKVWYDNLLQSEDRFKSKPSSATFEDRQNSNEGFASYLSHLIHYLHVHQRNSEERLAHQQIPLAEFQGINLNTARDLYMTYSKELSDVESQVIQQRFIIGQISDPYFEISSLSTVLTDPISTEMISKASHIILSLKDLDNRTTREQERLKGDLDIQKKFLTTHLEQAILILELRRNFLKEKIQNLQSINLSLIQEQISILENQIKDYISSAKNNLKQEQLLLEKNLNELRIEMAAFPKKWAAEQLIQQQMEINKNMVEEITKLVESKNISSNLEKIQSAPVDLPLIPIHPKSPLLLMLTILGAIAGTFLGFTWALIHSIREGLEATEENLRISGQHVSGTLSRQYRDSSDKDPILDSDLETLRRLIAFMTPNNSLISSSPFGKTLVLIEGKGPNYANILADLLSKMSLKILVIDLHFEDCTDNSPIGLLQYLEGKISEPMVIHKPSYDLIAAGGICRYANELIGSQKFKNLIHRAAEQLYDWVIISSQATSSSAEAECLLEFFPNAAVSLTGEPLTALRHYFNYSRKPNTRLSFIMTIPRCKITVSSL